MKNRARRRISALLGILLLSYVVYQIYLINRGQIATEMATYATVEDTITTQGFAIRDEIVINTTVNGVLDYCVADGDRVAKEDPIANVYQNSSEASVQSQITRLQNELEMLESLNVAGENYVSDPTMVNEQIYLVLDDILLGVNQSNFNDLKNKRDKFQMAVSRKNLIIGQETAEDYQPYIQALRLELSTLESNVLEADSVISSPEAGYFISKVDGYESIVDVEEVGDLTPSQVNELLETDIEVNNDNTIGKICHSFKWYIACVLTEDEAIALEGLSSVELEIPFATTQKIPAEIVSLNKDSETGEVAAVFYCMNMDADIARIRNESIQIIVQTYSGVLVNEDSIYFNDVEYEEVDENGDTHTIVKENVKGVYILNNDRIEFVQIFTYKTINGYAICKTDLSDEEYELLYTSKTISLYDEVVSRASDLYDGKIV